MRTISRRTSPFRARAANRHSSMAPSGRSRTHRPSLLLKPPTLRRLSLPHHRAGSIRSTRGSRHLHRRGLRLRNQTCRRPVSPSGTAPAWSVSLARSLRSPSILCNHPDYSEPLEKTPAQTGYRESYIPPQQYAGPYSAPVSPPPLPPRQPTSPGVAAATPPAPPPLPPPPVGYKPQETPIPGQPYLHEGKLLVYPVSPAEKRNYAPRCRD